MKPSGGAIGASVLHVPTAMNARPASSYGGLKLERLTAARSRASLVVEVGPFALLFLFSPKSAVLYLGIWGKCNPMPHDVRSNVGTSNEDSHREARWPPRGGVLDWLARWLEGGGDGVKTEQLLDLSTVLASQAKDALDPEVARFYLDPGRYRMRAGVHASRFSGALLDLLAAVSRQGRLPDRDCGKDGSDGFEGYPVRQLVYRDARGRTHWDLVTS